MPKAKTHEVVVNGSFGEGGGALLRAALAVSALTQQPMRIHHVRGATRKPGLTSEDLTFLQVLEESCNAEVTGADLNADEFSFAPTRAPAAVRRGFDVRSHEKGTVPGNALMIGQSLMPVLARAGKYSFLNLKGEIFNPNTLTFDAFERATLKVHAKQGLVAFARLIEAGFGYAGHGELALEIEPSVFNGFEWKERGELLRLSGVISYAGIHDEMIERGQILGRSLLVHHDPNAEFESIETPSRQHGCHVTVIAQYERGLGVGSAIGMRGARVESVVRQAIDKCAEFMASKATLDPFLADQVLLPAVFAGQPTTFLTSQVTPRLQTMAWVAKQFMPASITILGRTGEPGKVSIS